MTQINRLQAALRAHLPWHGARLTFLALFLVALFRVETVNLDKLASVFANRAKPESSYKRLTRFLREFPLDFDDIAQAVVSWSQIPQPWTLSLDRTTWSFGSVHFNILMLGIVHEGVAFPLFWTMLDKRGNSHSDERIDLLERFEQVFPKAKVRCLTTSAMPSGSVNSSLSLPWPSVGPCSPGSGTISTTQFLSSPMAAGLRVCSATGATSSVASAAIWPYDLPSSTRRFNFCPRTETYGIRLLL